jgi:hypothetical protein
VQGQRRPPYPLPLAAQGASAALGGLYTMHAYDCGTCHVLSLTGPSPLCSLCTQMMLGGIDPMYDEQD